MCESPTPSSSTDSSSSQQSNGQQSDVPALAAGRGRMQRRGSADGARQLMRDGRRRAAVNAGPRRIVQQIRRATFVPPADHDGAEGQVRPLRDWQARLILRSLQISILVNAILAAAKIVVGLSALEAYVIAGALVNAGVAGAKIFILLGTADNPRAGGHYHPYRSAGYALLAAGLSYTAGCAAAAGGYSSYSRAVAIVIATSSFVELGTAAVGVLTSRRFWTPLVQANKLVNLAGGLVALALTQVAILSFAQTGDVRLANGGFTIGVGVCVTGIGLWMVHRARTRLQAASGTTRPPRS